MINYVAITGVLVIIFYNFVSYSVVMVAKLANSSFDGLVHG